MKNIYEVFEEFEKADTKDAKVGVLQKNSSWALRNVLKGTFDPDIKFNVEKVPHYRPGDSPPGMSYTSLHKELDRVYLFQEGNPKAPAGLTEQRREQILIQILEALEQKEAQVFMNMLLKKQKVPGLTAKIVKEAFPDLF
jgi:hypothetical protein